MWSNLKTVLFANEKLFPFSIDIKTRFWLKKAIVRSKTVANIAKLFFGNTTAFTVTYGYWGNEWKSPLRQTLANIDGLWEKGVGYNLGFSSEIYYSKVVFWKIKVGQLEIEAQMFQPTASSVKFPSSFLERHQFQSSAILAMLDFKKNAFLVAVRLYLSVGLIWHEEQFHLVDWRCALPHRRPQWQRLSG